jgi:hypothetical protein
MGRFKGDEKNFLDVIGPSFQEWPRLLKQGAAAFVFMSTAEVINVANRVPLKFKRMLWMYKAADCTYPLHGWLLTSEAILWFVNGEGCNLFDRHPYRHDCYLANHIGGEGVEGHPTVKPLEVVKDLCLRCPEGGTILDPFMGSGTTAIAAMEHSRNFLGCEIEPKYVAIAQARIDAERKQIKLF